MTGDIHNIDDLFKEGLDGKEEVPEEKVWKAIEQDLDKISAISIREKYVRLRRTSAILLILLLGVSIYAIRNTITGNSGKVAEYQQTKLSGSVKNQPSNSILPGENGNGLVSSDSKTTSSTTGNDKSVANSVNNDASIKNTSAEKSGQNNAALSSVITKTGPANVSENGSIVNGSATRNNSSTKINQAAKRVKSINALAGGAFAASSNQPYRINSSGNNKNNGKKNKTSEGNNDETLTSYRNTSNSGIENSFLQPAAHQPMPREMAIPEISYSRQFPLITLKISSANALSDAVKSTPANTLSIPVKNRKNDKLNIPRFSITPMASLNLMSNKIENDDAHPGSQGNEKYEIEETESEKLSYTYSLLFDVKIARRMTLQTGIGYMQKTTAIEPKEIGAVRTPEGKVKYQFDCSAGRYYLSPKYGTWPRVGDSTYTITSANELHFITVPLAVKYYFGKNKLNFYAIAGADANFLLGQDLTTGLYGASYYAKKTPPKPIGLNKVLINATLGGGINYSLTRWLGFTLSPTYRFALNTINKDMSFKAYPRNFSLAGGLRFSF